VAGQHVDIRLTAENGYTAQRSYSIASTTEPDRLTLTVEKISNGEVSPYLVDVMRPGDRMEIRGPIGGWFVWRAGVSRPALLVGGGSGVVPLMAMIRRATLSDRRGPVRLIYSTRTPDHVYYSSELADLAARHDWLTVDHLYTRSAPPDSHRGAHRLTADDLTDLGDWSGGEQPLVFVCGPSGFVENAADHLQRLGHPAINIRTERFGPTGSTT
jgi:ferredoxin-NADP reductase